MTPSLTLRDRFLIWVARRLVNLATWIADGVERSRVGKLSRR
jgi:hypothetical protein